MQVKAQVIRIQMFVHQKFRKTCQRQIYMIQQLHNSDFQWMIRLQITSFCFQLPMLLLLTLKTIIQGVTG